MLYGKDEEYRECVERRMEVKGEKNFGTTDVEEMDEPNSTRTEKTGRLLEKSMVRLRTLLEEANEKK